MTQHMTPKHWLDALENDTVFQEAKLAADKAFLEYQDIQSYASSMFKRARDLNLSTRYDAVYMFGAYYLDAEIGAYVYAAKLEYERLQARMNAETQRVFKNA